jgi:hypothetical protein
MASQYPFPSLLPIERPRCQRCQSRMQLISVQPSDNKGFEYRTFECGKCESQQTVTTVTDPMRTEKVIRLAEALRPPE